MRLVHSVSVCQRTRVVDTVGEPDLLWRYWGGPIGGLTVWSIVSLVAMVGVLSIVLFGVLKAGREEFIYTCLGRDVVCEIGCEAASD